MNKSCRSSLIWLFAAVGLPSGCSIICQAVTDEGEDFIPKFVSISTPWGGHQAAESGIRHLKKPVPSWFDDRPDCDLPLNLYANPLPSGTVHHLICGSIKGRPFYINGENDCVVPLACETDPCIKNKTASFKHYGYEHTEMLGQPDVLSGVESILKN